MSSDKMIILVGITVGLLILIYGLYEVSSARSFASNAQKTKGRIIEFKIQRVSKTPSGRALKVSFEDSLGETVTFTGSGKNNSDFDVGKLVDVLYDPQDSKNAIVAGNQWRIPLGISSLGLALLAIFLFIFFFIFSGTLHFSRSERSLVVTLINSNEAGKAQGVEVQSSGVAAVDGESLDGLYSQIENFYLSKGMNKEAAASAVAKVRESMKPLSPDQQRQGLKQTLTSLGK
jgi:hypothetical protein